MSLWKTLTAPFRKSQLVERIEPLSLINAAGWGIETGYAGEDVTPQGLLGLSAAWACVNLIAGTIGSLPLMVYRTDSRGARTVAREHPLYRILHDSPNADQTTVDFLEFACSSIELWGNGYATKDKGTGGRLVGLTPVRPDIVTVSRQRNGRLR